MAFNPRRPPRRAEVTTVLGAVPAAAEGRRVAPSVLGSRRARVAPFVMKRKRDGIDVDDGSEDELEVFFDKLEAEAPIAAAADDAAPDVAGASSGSSEAASGLAPPPPRPVPVGGAWSDDDFEDAAGDGDSEGGGNGRPPADPEAGPVGPGPSSAAAAAAAVTAADGRAAFDDDSAWAERLKRGRLTKGDKLAELAARRRPDAAPFRRAFYAPPPELASMPAEEVSALRRRLDGLKVRGRDVPAPVSSWNQAGLSGRLQAALRAAGFAVPMPVQAQALPALMGGRDVLGIAKTGSGKTLAYLLPLLRHVRDQPAVADGDGPIGLVIAPTRELVAQIGRECRRFARPLGLRCVSVFGGSGVAGQIADLKRGAEMVAATPGRLIDLLASGAGRITNLWRVTFLIIDEADRLFDLGFEPQVARLVDLIRPDRQTALFSATFPKPVEVLARGLLRDPVELLVGGRSVVNPSVRQRIEVRGGGGDDGASDDRLARLLELLGEWWDRGKVLVFVQTQEACDRLFRDLLRLGYPCLALHGGKEQTDRAGIISDFKAGVSRILVATSLAARGLDVADLALVVNYDCPNHLEDYVHRVGRTGRAGRDGDAVTFIAPDEGRYAGDLVRALRASNHYGILHLPYRWGA